MSWVEAASTICFKPFSFEEAVRGLAEGGFENVELSAVKGSVEHLDPDELSPERIGRAQEILDRHGVRAVSVSGHGELHTDAGLQRHRRVLHAAHQLGATVLITFSDRAESPDAWQPFIANARILADEAQELGITLCFENHSGRIATAALCRRLLAELDHPWIRMNYDSGNASFHAGVRPEQDVEHALPFLGHVHLKDQRGGKGSLDFPPLGDGDIDVAALLSKISGSGFSGPVSLEIVFDATWPDWDRCLAAVQRSKAYWQSLTMPGRA